MNFRFSAELIDIVGIFPNSWSSNDRLFRLDCDQNMGRPWNTPKTERCSRL